MKPQLAINYNNLLKHFVKPVTKENIFFSQYFNKHCYFFSRKL